jgi:hypothetical protein
MVRIAEKVEVDFTDEVITGSVGSVFLSRMSRHLGIPALLENALKLKQRRRGSSNFETMLSLIYCLAQSDGSLVDGACGMEARRSVCGCSVILGWSAKTSDASLHLHTCESRRYAVGRTR